VSYELEPKVVERRFFTCEQLIQRQQRKGFLHRIVTGDEKWIFYDKKKKYYAKPNQSLPSTSISTPRPNIHSSKNALYLVGPKGFLGYYELLKPGDSITGDRYWLQLIRLNRALREKWPEYEQRHDKVILLHDNARPHVAKVVKKYLKTLKWMFYRTRRILRTLLLLITGCCSRLLRRMQQVTGSLLSQKSKIGSKIGSPPKTSHFFEMEFENCLRDEKKK